MHLLITGMILFGAAMVCMAAELFVPSHGILGAICIILALIGCLFLYWFSPVLGVIGALVLLIGTPVAFAAWVRYYPSTPVGRRVLLKPMASPDTSSRPELANLVGKRGVAVTLLRPSGACEFDGQRMTCVSESDIITPGTPVEVVRVTDLRIIVRPAPTA